MALDQIILAVSGAVSGVIIERIRSQRQRVKERDNSALLLRQAELTDEAAKRKEIETAATEIREFLRNRVAELDRDIDALEDTRLAEREKWHQMLGDLNVKNLELELQHRKDMARISELEEEAQQIDDEVRTLRTRIAVANSDAITMSAKLDQCRLECERLKVRLVELK